MKHVVLIAVGKKDDRGNIFKPSREKAAGIPGALRNLINKATLFVYDGTSGGENTLRCVLAGAGLPDSLTTSFVEYEKLCAAYPEGPTYTEMAHSWKFICEQDAANLVVCIDVVYLRSLARYILDRDLKYEVEEADAVLINFGEDGKTPDSTELISPYVG